MRAVSGYKEIVMRFELVMVVKERFPKGVLYNHKVINWLAAFKRDTVETILGFRIEYIKSFVAGK